MSGTIKIIFIMLPGMNGNKTVAKVFSSPLCVTRMKPRIPPAKIITVATIAASDITISDFIFECSFLFERKIARISPPAKAPIA